MKRITEWLIDMAYAAKWHGGECWEWICDALEVPVHIFGTVVLLTAVGLAGFCWMAYVVVPLLKYLSP